MSELAPIVELTRDVVVAILDEVSLRRLGMDARSAFAAYYACELEDWTPIADMLVFADILADDDELFLPKSAKTTQFSS